MDNLNYSKKAFKEGESVNYWNEKNLLSEGTFVNDLKLGWCEMCLVKSKEGELIEVEKKKIYHEWDPIIL